MKQTKKEDALLRREIEKLRKELLSERERRQKSEEAFQWLSGHMKGFKQAESILQRIDAVGNYEAATSLLEDMLGQDGCLGGRILQGWRVQSFWEDDNPPALWQYLQFDNELLPDGMRHCYCMPNQYLAVGIIPERMVKYLNSK